MDADYLDAGHLDHGYALTDHAAQDATMDQAFVLGSDDAYREWGYTALSRHREKARFYVVSDGRPEPALPGLEPTPDPLIADVVVSLGPSRRKRLALDCGTPVRATAEPSPFAAVRDAERAERRLAADAARARRSLEDTTLRLSALEAELDATPGLRRRARAEVREAIARQRDVVGRWEATCADLDAEMARVESVLAESAARLAPSQATRSDSAPQLTPADLGLEPDIDLGP